MAKTEPPSDPEAEKRLVGAAIVDPAQVDALMARLSVEDFFISHYAQMYGAIVDLVVDNQPVSSQTVARRAKLPVADVAGCMEGADPEEATFWADRIVKTRKLRSLLAVGEAAIQAATSDPADADAAALRIEAMLSRDDAAASEAVDMKAGTSAALARIRRYIHEPDLITGLETGWHYLDRVLDGLQAGAVTSVYARTGQFKALALDTPIPTPIGWTAMGDLHDGDLVFNEKGEPVHVLAAHPVITPPRAYALEFSDGEVIEACGDHRWLTWSASERAARNSRNDEYRAIMRERRRVKPNRQRKFVPRSRGYVCKPPPAPSIRTTQEIFETLRAKGRLNHAVQLSKPLQLPDAALPIDPYLLGVWLGDGTTLDGGITSADQGILDAFTAAGYRIGKITSKGNCFTFRPKGFKVQLRAAGLLGNKHIPLLYLRASEAQRVALLQGLMDTDGSVGGDGSCLFGVTNEALARGAHALILSLGHRARLIERRAWLDGRDCGPLWTTSFTGNRVLFRLARKVVLQKVGASFEHFRYITDCRPIEPKPMRCITVDGESHLFLAGRALIPTHNSMFCQNIMWRLGSRGVPGAAFTTEMTHVQVMERLIQLEAGLNFRELRWQREMWRHENAIEDAVHCLEEYPIWINDRSLLDVGFIKGFLSRLKRTHGIQYAVVDLLDHVVSSRYRDNETKNEAFVMQQMKQLAKELDIHIMLTTHVAKPDRSAMPGSVINESEMKGSSAKSQDADCAISLVLVKEGDMGGWAPMNRDERLAAQRNGDPLHLMAGITKNRSGELADIPFIVRPDEGGRMMPREWNR